MLLEWVVGTVQRTSMRVPDMSSGTRSPVAASSSSTCAQQDPVRRRAHQQGAKLPTVQASHQRLGFVCDRLVAQAPTAENGNGGCAPALRSSTVRTSASACRLCCAHLDLALAFRKQLVADPVLVRKVAGAALVGVLLAEHAVALVAPMVPAAQRPGQLCRLAQATAHGWPTLQMFDSWAGFARRQGQCTPARPSRAPSLADGGPSHTTGGNPSEPPDMIAASGHAGARALSAPPTYPPGCA